MDKVATMFANVWNNNDKMYCMLISVCVCSMLSEGICGYGAITEEHTDYSIAQEDTEMEKDSF